MLTLNLSWICEVVLSFLFLSSSESVGIGLTGTVSILSWEEVYCIVAHSGWI